MSALQPPSKGGHRGGSLAWYSRFVFGGSALLGSIFPLCLMLRTPEPGGGFGHSPLSSFACSDSIPPSAEPGRDSVSICSESGVPDCLQVLEPGKRCALRDAGTPPTGAEVGHSPAERAPTFAFSWEMVKKASWKLPSQINEHFQT